jgi:hypothetical protein
MRAELIRAFIVYRQAFPDISARTAASVGVETWASKAAPETHWSAAAGLAQGPFDLVDRNSNDLGDLRDGHAVLHPDAYPGNL